MYQNNVEPNMNQNGYSQYTDTGVQVEQEVMSRVFLFMCVALAITSATAYFTATSGLFYRLMENRYTLIGMIVAELVVVIAATSAIKNDNAVLASMLFFVYSVINGVTLSYIFFVYEIGSIASVFVTTAIVFGVMAGYGILTKKDLTSIGSIGMMALIGLIVASVLNLLIFRSSAMDFVCSIIGLAIFIGLTAYDAQKIKDLTHNDRNTSLLTISIYGALELYLDFINMFLRLLRLFGKRSN